MDDSEVAKQFLKKRLLSINESHPSAAAEDATRQRMNSNMFEAILFNVILMLCTKHNEPPTESNV